ncbi:SIMPL domain-containing protein [Arthrobacter sp. ISL-30]|uniref:SIMPL domain-containing protein n=1 Tax=Arthrobacter sp. ISL-30 TaxID=2819109 RepID=UPI001BE9EB6D|nr:SIMPL domain-containing protein [Arthrobacter sp. ISL-30]MBT2514215.1 SIMPL domain-containing protein [Arthrobacter sp. ISL-30]
MTRTITVTGNGSAQAAPDMLTVSFGVETRRGAAGAAYDDVGASAAAISAALRDHGVPDADIRTSALNLRAELLWQEGQGQRVTGYLASTVLSVSLRQLSSASATISAAVEAGGDAIRLNGMELGFADASAVTARAREAAWKDAVAKATQFASLAESTLGQVVSVEQNPSSPPPIPMGGGMLRAAAVDSVTIEPGETSVDASVTVAWELQTA